MNIAYLINGIPGAGKTTTARALAARLPRAAHMEGDVLQEFVVSGLVYPGREPASESNAQIQLCIRNQCVLARSFLESGFVPVMDWVIVDHFGLDQYHGHLPGVDLRLVTLAPGIETALARDRARPEKTVAHLWTHLEQEMLDHLYPEGLWIDNAQITIDDVVSSILANFPPTSRR